MTATTKRRTQHNRDDSEDSADRQTDRLHKILRTALTLLAKILSLLQAAWVCWMMYKGNCTKSYDAYNNWAYVTEQWTRHVKVGLSQQALFFSWVKALTKFDRQTVYKSMSATRTHNKVKICCWKDWNVSRLAT